MVRGIQMKSKLYIAGITAFFLVCYIYYKFYKIEEGFKMITTNAMIIIEPRRHPLLKKVIENFDTNMDASWDLYVYHGKSHSDYAKMCTENITKRKVVLLPLGTDNMTATDYNRLFKKKQFWNTVNAENILVFQTDSVLCGKSLHKINEYTSYDYIGCSYDNKTIGTRKFVHWGPEFEFYGVGGLSFRRKSFMLECINDNPNVPDDFGEDIYFSQCVARSFNRPPNAKVLNEFCTQFIFDEKSFGAHKTNIDLLSDKSEFYEYCPEAIMLESS